MVNDLIPETTKFSDLAGIGTFNNDNLKNELNTDLEPDRKNEARSNHRT